MHGSNSGLTNGSLDLSQMTLEQDEYEVEAIEIEELIEKEFQDYLSKCLPLSSPITVPSDATIVEELKNGYRQVKYIWTDGDYKYTSRWHTRTPNAPLQQGNTWVVERKRNGIGSGPNARKKVEEVMVGINKDGNPKWISKRKWNEAIKARKTGTITKEQEKILYDGHWKSKE
ncbi:MAG: hypothetical protein Q4C49_14585 [Bacillota bacterium]|nr:hypothetical protein [Bacillota bacterium]